MSETKTVTEQVTESQLETEQETNQEENKSGITLNDIVGMRNIINIASRRGAFSAEEFKEIGTIYDKVDKFIKENVKTIEDEKKEE